MSPTLIVLLIILGVVVLAAVVVLAWGVSVYNGLVTLRNRFKNAYAQIDVQLKRRYDLIPNLVETAKAYLTHERETLEKVIAARNQSSAAAARVASDPSDGAAMQQLIGAESGLASSLGRLMVSVEAYPNLKADQNMRQLTEELTSTENKIGFARQAYNDAVMTFNTAREVFPSSLIAGMFNFQAAVSFEITDAAQKEAPKVSFAK